MRARLLIAALSTALGCAACGFKGPLYLPGRNGTVVTRAAPPAKTAPDRSQAPAKPKHKNGQAGAAQASPGPG